MSTVASLEDTSTLSRMLLRQAIGTGDLGVFEAATKCVLGRLGNVRGNANGIIVRPEG